MTKSTKLTKSQSARLSGLINDIRIAEAVKVKALNAETFDRERFDYWQQQLLDAQITLENEFGVEFAERTTKGKNIYRA